MTLEEMKQSDAAFLVATDIAPILGCDPCTIRVAARQRPDLLGFPVTVMGSRVKIPRLPFIRYVEGKQ